MGLLSGVGSLLGMGPSQGLAYQNPNLDNAGTKSLAEMLAAGRSGQVSDAGKGLVDGSQSLSQALSGLSGDQSAGLASSPIYGQAVAAQQTQNDPVLSGLLGKGGQLQQAEAQDSQLANQGFQLQPQDIEAYGQASGNIARQFGQSDQSLASALAARGLAAGGSGAGAAQFSGLQGNKNEQLGQMQMQIANDRMQNTAQRLQQTRAFETSMGQLGQNSENSNFNNNLKANSDRTNQANDLAGNQNRDYTANADQAQAAIKSQQGAQTQTLGDALSQGLYKGVAGAASAGTGAAISSGLGLPASASTTDPTKSKVNGT